MSNNNFDKIASEWARAFTLTLLSSVSEGDDTIIKGRLHLLYMRINPYGLFSAEAIGESLAQLSELGLRDFFLRLTARCQFSMGLNDAEFVDLCGKVYDSCNIHASIAKVAGDPDEQPVNHLGEQNADAQLSKQDSIAIISVNRWYLTVCLFILMYNGGVK